MAQRSSAPADRPNLLASCADASIETAQELMHTKGNRLLVVTGGAAVVQEAFRAARRSSPPVPAIRPWSSTRPPIIDKAARDITASASLDNNIIAPPRRKRSWSRASPRSPAHGERRVAIACRRRSGPSCASTSSSKERGPGKPGVIRRELIGKNANVILARIGVHVGEGVRLALVPCEADDPLVWTEQLMPVYPGGVRCATAMPASISRCAPSTASAHRQHVLARHRQAVGHGAPHQHLDLHQERPELRRPRSGRRGLYQLHDRQPHR
jgi:hypothetical protein